MLREAFPGMSLDYQPLGPLAEEAAPSHSIRVRVSAAHMSYIDGKGRCDKQHAEERRQDLAKQNSIADWWIQDLRQKQSHWLERTSSPVWKDSSASVRLMPALVI